MLIHAQTLAAAKFASTDTTRVSLNNIKIDSDRTCWASDGAIAIRVDAHDNLDPALFPTVPGVPDNAIEPAGPVLIPAKIALAAIKAIPKKPATEQLACVQILQVPNELTYLVTSTLDAHTVTPVMPEDPSTYPDVEAIWPEEAEVVDAPETSGFDAVRLAPLMAFAKQHQRGKLCPVQLKLQLRGAHRPASIKWVSNYASYHAIIMPMRLAHGTDAD